MGNQAFRGSPDSARLRRIHEAVGRVREERAPHATGEIAIHYDQAGLGRDAYRFALRAAEQAKQSFAHDEAAQLLAIAERNASTAAERAEIRLRRAQLLEATGRYEDARDLCDSAIGECGTEKEPLPTITFRRLRERMREMLGQPASDTLVNCGSLCEEAGAAGNEKERVLLKVMISQSHSRMGQTEAAREAADDAVRLAEKLGDPSTLAMALNRSGLVKRSSDPARAVENWRKALELFRAAGDHRGEATVRNNLGIYYTDRCEFEKARAEFDAATESARRAGNRSDLGSVMMNLGVAVLKNRDFNRAHQLLGEALAIFASLKNNVWQLYALYNLAHLALEQGESEHARELYDFTADLARRVGQSDVEIGATAGAGLANLRLGKPDAARSAADAAQERLQGRPEWFHGRELAEALRIRLAAQNGRRDEALERFDTAVGLAEAADFYCAAWLTSECADTLLGLDRDRVRPAVSRFADRARQVGLGELSRRCQEVLTRH